MSQLNPIHSMAKLSIEETIDAYESARDRLVTNVADKCYVPTKRDSLYVHEWQKNAGEYKDELIRRAKEESCL